jgi:hypothetical protein
LGELCVTYYISDPILKISPLKMKNDGFRTHFRYGVNEFLQAATGYSNTESNGPVEMKTLGVRDNSQWVFGLITAINQMDTLCNSLMREL